MTRARSENSLRARGGWSRPGAVSASSASADCYGFRGKDAVVCVRGSDNAARGRAASVCEDETGSSCSISGVLGSTRQEGNSRQCYDESGERSRQPTGY